MTLRILSDEDFDKLIEILGEAGGSIVITKESTLRNLGFTPEDHQLLKDRTEEYNFGGNPDLTIDLATGPGHHFFPRERCCVCGGKVAATMKCRREHLEGHHPTATNMTAREVLEQFEEE